MEKAAIVVLVIIILLVAALAVYGGQADSRVCKDAGYEDYHEDSTGGFCYLWDAGLKVLTPFGDVE